MTKKNGAIRTINLADVNDNIIMYEYKNNKWSLIKFETEENNSNTSGILIKNNNFVTKDYNYLDRRNKERQDKKESVYLWKI